MGSPGKKILHPLLYLLRRWFPGICIPLPPAALPWLWWPQPNIREVTHPRREDPGEAFVRNWKNLDPRIDDAAREGNVAIRFPGFSADNPNHVRTVQEACWPGSYAIYPRRVFAAMPGTVTNNGSDVLSSPFDPSLDWLQDHNVRSVINLIARGDSFEPRGQYVPQRGGR